MKLKLVKPTKDAFDDIPDAFDSVDLPTEEKVIYSDEFQKMLSQEVKKAIAGIKLPETQKEIVREVKVEAKKDDRKYADKSALDEALKKISELEKELKETRRRADSPIVIPSGPGGSGVIGVPAPEGHEGKILKVINGKWDYGASAGGGITPVDTYTLSNVTTNRTLDASSDSTTLQNVIDVLGSLIQSLKDVSVIL